MWTDLRNDELIMIFRMNAFKITQLTATYAVFDTLPASERTIIKLREMVEVYAGNESAAARYASVLQNRSDTWDGMARMHTFDDVIHKYNTGQSMQSPLLPQAVPPNRMSQTQFPYQDRHHISHY